MASWGKAGQGKTTLGNCLIRVLTPGDGEIVYRKRDGNEVDLVKLDRAGLRPVHREIRMVFQDPFASLNPRMTVAQVVGEPLLVNGLLSGRALLGAGFRVADESGAAAGCRAAAIRMRSAADSASGS